MARTVANSWAGLGIVAAMAVVEGRADASGAPRVHDKGLLIQLTTGVGYYHTSSSSPGFDQTYAGTTLDLGLMMGGTLEPGLIVGGGLFLDRAGSPTVEQNGTEVEADITQYVVGLGGFVDYYLKPQGGWHVQGFLGWGGLETDGPNGAGGSDPTGLIVAIGGGKDWWISDTLAVGVLGRIVYGKLSLLGTDFPTWAPAVLATFTWH